MPKYQKIFLFLLGVIVLSTFIQMFGKAYRAEGYDFTAYLMASKAFFHAENPYSIQTHFPYIYPLFPCAYLGALAWMPYWLANTIWFFLNLSAVFYALFTMQQYIYPEKNFGQKLYLSALVLILLLNVTRNNLLNGQINFLVIALCVMFFKKYQEKHIIISSLYLALAIATKLTPGIFLFYLLFNKAYKACLATLFFSLLFILILPGLIVGPEKLLAFYQYYILSIQANAASHNQHHILLSLSSVANTLFTLTSPHRLLALWPSIALVGMYFLQQRSNNQTSLFSLYMILPLLISPMSETHHLASLFIPLLALLPTQTSLQIKTTQTLILISVIVLIWLGNWLIFGFFLATVLLIALMIKDCQSPHL